MPRTTLFFSFFLALPAIGCSDTKAPGGDDTVPDADACAPKTSCDAGPVCLNVQDNTGSLTPGLRVSQMTISKPNAFASGIMNNVLSGGAMPNDASCNLQGGGTISVLLQFDTAAGTLKVGGAKPVADASQGYSFVQEDVSGVSVSPASLQASVDGSGKFSASAGVDVVLPAYLDQSDSNVMLLPMKALTVSGTLSSDGNCIGSYNASGLNPADSCLPTGDIPAFLDGGTLEAHITLEEADQVMLSVTQQSLCVLLSGNASQYADGARCKRDGDGTIVYQGDWCDLTNNAASGDCADSVRFQADIAASGVLINP